MDRRVTFALGFQDEIPADRLERVRSLLCLWLWPTEHRPPQLLRGRLVAGIDGVLYLDTVVRARHQWDLQHRIRVVLAEPLSRLLHCQLPQPQVASRAPDPAEWPTDEMPCQEPRQQSDGEDGQQ